MKPQQPTELHQDMPIDRKKEYQHPQFTQYGDLRELTENNGNGPNSDSGNNMMAPSMG